MNIKELVSHIAKKEGRKHQASVGDVREIVGIISDVIFDKDWDSGHLRTLNSLIANGKRRAKRKKR